MENRNFEEKDLPALRGLLGHAGGNVSLAELEESMQIEALRGRTRLWLDKSHLIGFAWVDNFNNLRYGWETGRLLPGLEDAIFEWGLTCTPDREATLDAPCASHDAAQIAMLESHGFRRGEVRTLRYSRSLLEPILDSPLPGGYGLRSVRGEQEVDPLVALHRAAFGTENMTVQERLAIMRAPGYDRAMDLLAVAPDGELAAFCICWLETPETGWTDPIGVHPRHQRIGLGSGILSAGLFALRERGAREARLGTSSENIPMQRLAESVGFAVASELLWFSRELN